MCDLLTRGGILMLTAYTSIEVPRSMTTLKRAWLKYIGLQQCRLITMIEHGIKVTIPSL